MQKLKLSSITQASIVTSILCYMTLTTPSIIFENHTEQHMVACINYEALGSTLCKPDKIAINPGSKREFNFPLNKALCKLSFITFETLEGKLYAELTRTNLPANNAMRILITMALHTKVYEE